MPCQHGVFPGVDAAPLTGSRDILEFGRRQILFREKDRCDWCPHVSAPLELRPASYFPDKNHK
jgi:hypothetical protein